MIYQPRCVKAATLETRSSNISKTVLRLDLPVKMSKCVSVHFAQSIPTLSFSSLLPVPPPPDQSMELHLLEEDTRPVRALELQD